MSDFVVAKNGNNSNPGTFIAPWSTIGYACSRVNTGDVITVRSGNYAEALEENVIPSGVTIKNYPGEIVWMNPSGTNRVLEFAGSQSYIIIDGINLDGTLVGYDTVKINAGSGFNAHHISLRNLEVIGSRSAMIEDRRSSFILATALIPGLIGSNEFINLVIHGYMTSFEFNNQFYIGSADNIIQNIDMYGPLANLQIYNGYDSTLANNNQIIGCRVHDVPFVSGHRGQGIIIGNGQGNRVENCEVYGVLPNASGSAGIEVYHANGTQLINNKVHDNASPGILVEVDSADTVVSGNSAWNNNPDFVNRGQRTIESGNSWGVPVPTPDPIPIPIPPFHRRRLNRRIQDR